MPHHPTTHTLLNIIEGAIEAGDFEDDPYSACITLVASSLDWALGFEMVGSMSDHEARILRAAERVLRTMDPDISTDIRP